MIIPEMVLLEVVTLERVVVWETTVTGSDIAMLTASGAAVAVAMRLVSVT